jgi:hypothetical protein
VASLEGPSSDEIVDMASGDSSDNLGTEEIHQLCIHAASISHRVLLGGTEHQPFLLFKHRRFSGGASWLHLPSEFSAKQPRQVHFNGTINVINFAIKAKFTRSNR